MRISITQFLRDHVTGDDRALGGTGEALVIPIGERSTAARTASRVDQGFDRLEKILGVDARTRRAPRRSMQHSVAERVARTRSRTHRTSGGGGGGNLLGIAAGLVAAAAIGALTRAHGSARQFVVDAAHDAAESGRAIVERSVRGVRSVALRVARVMGDASDATMRGVRSAWHALTRGVRDVSNTSEHAGHVMVERTHDPVVQWREPQPELHDELPNTGQATMRGVEAFWKNAIAAVRAWLLGIFDGTSNDIGAAAGTPRAGGSASTPGSSGGGGQTPSDASAYGGGGTPRAVGRGTRTGDDPSRETVPEPGASGQYRPVYKLGEADLSDEVVRTVANEATSGKASTDAVINSMFNRLGSHGYGPSSNLRDVAAAPGQFAGHDVQRRPSPDRAEQIRERIRQIASGAVPDITHGSNEFRSQGYSGQWARRHADDGEVIGGNRFARNPRAVSPYAPYGTPGARRPDPAPTVANNDAAPRPSTSTPNGATARGTPSSVSSAMAPSRDAPHDAAPAGTGAHRDESDVVTSAPTDAPMTPTGAPSMATSRTDDDATPQPVSTRRTSGGSTPAADATPSRERDESPRGGGNDDHRRRRLIPRHVHDAGAGLLVIGSSAYA